jgi:hypothetical protein
MKKLLPVLALLAGLGSSISFAQAAQQKDPFSQYLAGIKGNSSAPSLMRIAQDCGVDINTVAPRYAVLPDNNWVLVKDLAKGLHGLETDFYETAALWKQADHVLVEIWEMQLDVGNENRIFYCIDHRKITAVESTDWMLPEVLENDKKKPGWGYEQRWDVTEAGKYKRTFHGFVDFNSEPMAEPKIDEKTRRSLVWMPKVRGWEDLKLPSSLLQ